MNVSTRDDIDRGKAFVGDVAGKARADDDDFLELFGFVSREGGGGRGEAQARHGQPEYRSPV